MNKVYKLVMALFVGVVMLGVAAYAQEPEVEGQAIEPQDSVTDEGFVAKYAGAMPVAFQSNKMCYIPEKQAFVAIDSIDCAIDLVRRMTVDGRDTMERIGRFHTDNTYKRHDLKNIHRPRSVWVMGDKIIFLASSAKDSAHIGVLSMLPDTNGNLIPVQSNDGNDVMIGLNFNAYAFDINMETGELVVVGTNPQGYSIEVFDITDGIENMVVKGAPFNYRVKKQAELIKDSDPYGIGLTLVAVIVVFTALICICLIMKAFAGIMMRHKNRKDKKAAAKESEKKPEPKKESGKADNEVYAAIATAIYLYNEELHDDEDMVITIQPADHTPWNNKAYNMNQYFNNRK